MTPPFFEHGRVLPPPDFLGAGQRDLHLVAESRERADEPLHGEAIEAGEAKVAEPRSADDPELRRDYAIRAFHPRDDFARKLRLEVRDGIGISAHVRILACIMVAGGARLRRVASNPRGWRAAATWDAALWDAALWDAALSDAALWEGPTCRTGNRSAPSEPFEVLERRIASSARSVPPSIA